MANKESTNLEVEAKYRVNTPGIASDLLSPTFIAPGFVAGPIFSNTNVDTYYDTNEAHLFQADIALRVRRTVSSCQVTVKSIEELDVGAVLKRVELESYVDATIGAPPFLSQTPAELREFVESSLAANVAMQPVLSLYQERVKRIIYTASADSEEGYELELAELSIDNVWVLATLDVRSVDTADTEDSVYNFTELELELLPNGNRVDFDRLVASISLSNDIVPSNESKLQVGLRAIGRIGA